MNILPKNSPSEQNLGPEQVVREALGVRVEVGTVSAENLKRSLIYQLPHVDFAATVSVPEATSAYVEQAPQQNAEPVAQVAELPIRNNPQPEVNENNDLSEIYQRIAEAQNEAA